MDVDDGGFRIEPFSVSDFVKRPTSTDDEMKKMQQRLLAAVSKSIEETRPAKVVAKQVPTETKIRGTSNLKITYDVRTGEMLRRQDEPMKVNKLSLTNTNETFIATAAEEVNADDLKELIYRLRDEWSAETGEWDGGKMPVHVLAEKLAQRIRGYKRPLWGE